MTTFQFSQLRHLTLAADRFKRATVLAHIFTLIIKKHFNVCYFRALTYTTLDRLCAVFLYYLFLCETGQQHYVLVLSICPPVDSFVHYQTCQHDILKTNESVSVVMEIGTSGQLQPLGGQRSSLLEAKMVTEMPFSKISEELTDKF